LSKPFLKVRRGDKLPFTSDLSRFKEAAFRQVEEVGSSGLVNDVVTSTVRIDGVSIARMPQRMANQSALTVVEISNGAHP
jgi:hypothetical protein